MPFPSGNTTATIADGAALSGAVDLRGTTLLGVMTPAAWTAAAITFDVSIDGTTYAPLYDSTGAEVTIPSASIATAAGRAFALDPVWGVAWNYLKVRSGTAAAPVNQSGAARVLTLVTRPLA